jgi:uncharacterized protein YjbI with pentapeptide repeats
MKKSQLVKLLRDHKNWLKGKGGKRLVATGMDFAGCDLSGEVLCKADLSKADLSKANLYMADLSEANLYRAHLSYTNLLQANLEGAILIDVFLLGTNLSGIKVNSDTQF